MKRTVPLGLCVVVLSLVWTATHLRAQGVWTQQTSGYEGAGLRLDWVTALDDNTAWVAGGSGYSDAVILKTTNGGALWQPQDSPIQTHLHIVVAASAQTAWIVGNSGTILKTTDGGTNWTEQRSGVSVNLLGATLALPSTLWAVGDGGTIIKTENGGQAWNQQNSGTGNNFHGITALDRRTAFAVGDQGIFKTDNGGGNWELVLPGLYKSLAIADCNNVWAAQAFGKVATSHDQGSTWTTYQATTTQWLYRIAAVSGTNAWVVGTGGTILRTVDGGATWVDETISTPDLFGIATAGFSARWVTGDNGLIFHSAPLLATTFGEQSGLVASSRSVPLQALPDGQCSRG